MKKEKITETKLVYSLQRKYVLSLNPFYGKRIQSTYYTKPTRPCSFSVEPSLLRSALLKLPG